MNKVDEHKKICTYLTDLYNRKNAAYGDSFSVARNVVPNYTLSVLYNKFHRFMTLSSGVENKVTDENIEDTLLDLANYAIMEVIERRNSKQKTKQTDDVENMNVEFQGGDWYEQT